MIFFEIFNSIVYRANNIGVINMKKKYLLFPLSIFLVLSFFDLPNKMIGKEQNYAPNKEESEEKPIVVVIASYNNQKYYKHNLESVFSQKYKNFRVIYTSDASTDLTADLVEEYVKQKGFEDKFTLISNKENKGACYNYYTMIQSCKKQEIVCILDGDDALSSENCLSRINKAYQDDDVWVTYGGVEEKVVENEAILKTNPKQNVYKMVWNYGSGPLSKSVLKKRHHRLVSIRFHHMRTFYAGLFHSIPKQKFIKNGDFYKTGWDIALVLFLIDRAGEHTYFIKDSLYEYNMNNPINDFRLDQIKQNWTALNIYLDKKLPPFKSKKDFL
jgi:glycosyltransferase involved in cell wall biosynthesis